jgi:phosphoribosylformimino-5-aminoimidazole carboxamide ribotide isomerase
VILYPAIDIQDGRAVRLVQGRFEDETVYRDDPLEAARDWVAAGAQHLHVVDLDGARSGEPKSLDHLERIARETGVPVQYGGGLRSIEAVRAALDAGAHRVILGTAAFRDLDLLDDAIAQYAPKLVVSVDVRGGCVATEGWTETTDMPAAAAIIALQDRGVRAFVYTDADRDGMLEGPDLDAVREVAQVVRGRWVYSGGIGTVDHLRSLARLRLLNLAGVISGKALYEGAFTVEEGLAALRSGR